MLRTAHGGNSALCQRAKGVNTSLLNTFPVCFIWNSAYVIGPILGFLIGSKNGGSSSKGLFGSHSRAMRGEKDSIWSKKDTFQAIKES